MARGCTEGAGELLEQYTAEGSVAVATLPFRGTLEAYVAVEPILSLLRNDPGFEWRCIYIQ